MSMHEEPAHGGAPNGAEVHEVTWADLPLSFALTRTSIHPSGLSPSDRLVPAVPFATVAVVAIIAGGLIAAVIAHDPTEHIVWMVAYLILVVGVAQFALGIGQSLLAVRKPPAGLLVTECAVFNIGNACVIAGTLLGRFPMVAAGGLLLVIALALFLYGARKARGDWLLYAYRGLLMFICVSAIVGVVLAAVEANP